MDMVSKELKKLTELKGLKGPTIELLKEALVNTDQAARSLAIAKLAFEYGWKGRSSHHELQMGEAMQAFLDTVYRQSFDRS